MSMCMLIPLAPFQASMRHKHDDLKVATHARHNMHITFRTFMEPNAHLYHFKSKCNQCT